MKTGGGRLAEGVRALGLSLMGAGLLWGCARASAPPGGPPDELPPFVVETSPDTFARLSGPGDLDGRVVFRFSERISERPSAGNWADAVTISPESGPVEVRTRRDALEIRPEGGFLADRVYKVSVQAVVRDLFGNVLLDPFELVFSTGPDFDSGVLAGLVWDRITGEYLRDHRVEAVASDDTTLVHLARTDSTGIFTLRYLPAGEYALTAYMDRNRNRTLDPPEPRGTDAMALGPTDTLVISIPVLEPDTTPAVLSGVSLLDSITVRLDFDDALDPERPTEGITWRLMRAADSVPIQTGRGIYHRAGLEALREAERPEEEEEQPAPAPGGGARAQPTTTPDGRPLPARELFLPLSTPLQPGEAHIVEVENVTNIQGVPGGGGSARLEVPLPDTVPTDTVPGAVPDTVPDTLVTADGRDMPAVSLRPRVLRALHAGTGSKAHVEAARGGSGG